MCQYNEDDDDKYKYVYDEDCLEYFTHEEKYIPKVKGHDDNSSKVNDENVETESYAPGTIYQELTIADDQVSSHSSNQSNDHHPGFFQKTSTIVFFVIAIILVLIIGIILTYFIDRKRRRKNRGPQNEIKTWKDPDSKNPFKPENPPIIIIKSQETPTGTTTPVQVPHQPPPTSQTSRQPEVQESAPYHVSNPTDPIGRVPLQSQSSRSSSASRGSPSVHEPSDIEPPIIQQHPPDYFNPIIDNPLIHHSIGTGDPPDNPGSPLPATPLRQPSRHGRSPYRGPH
ncbi:6997_t:CDS:1 [Funneliformis mosseae]|uniref:6997_t:CDS:1 n=1 Tax=Funneliformis mosseae TaxID=27381 RepID=A0A9N9AZ10_FUNMO|nr:6997_t:CDS:1 [Funneliformis mosseae]